MAVKLWSVKNTKLADVVPLPNNARFIQEKNLKGLRKSLEKFGVVELPVVNKTTGHLVSGHQRFEIFKEKNIVEMPMIVVEMSLEDELAASLTINNPNIAGEWTPAVVEIMSSLEASDRDLCKLLNLDTLVSSLKEFMPKMPANPETGTTDFSLLEKEVDAAMTKCPCCGHKFSMEAKDVCIEEPV